MPVAPPKLDTTTIRAFDMDIEVREAGSGPPMVLLQDEEALTEYSGLLDRLAQTHHLIMPSPPGFGRSERPSWIETVDDLAYIMLDVLEALDVRDAALVGCSFGGWLVAEMATKSCAHLSRLVLVDPLGIKVGGPYDRDIQDLWYLPPQRVMELKYAHPEAAAIDYQQLPEERLQVIARNRESLARFGWQPYLHNPKLRQRLHRISVPAFVVWGAQDGVVTPDYGRAYAAEIPGARFEVLSNAGHYPHLEQPEAFLHLLASFLAQP